MSEAGQSLTLTTFGVPGEVIFPASLPPLNIQMIRLNLTRTSLNRINRIKYAGIIEEGMLFVCVYVCTHTHTDIHLPAIPFQGNGVLFSRKKEDKK